MNLAYNRKCGIPDTLYCNDVGTYSYIKNDLISTLDVRATKNLHYLIFNSHLSFGQATIPAAKNYLVCHMYRDAIGYYTSLFTLWSPKFINILTEKNKKIVNNKEVFCDLDEFLRIEKKIRLINRYNSYAKNILRSDSKTAKTLNFFTDDPKKVDYLDLIAKINSHFGLGLGDSDIEISVDRLKPENIRRIKRDTNLKKNIVFSNEIYEYIGNFTAGSESLLRDSVSDRK